MHKAEAILTSNSSRLSTLSLKNCHIHYRGDVAAKLDLSFIDQENFSPLYLYPSEDSQLLDSELMSSLEKPIQLIIPDGTWRQTKNIYRREEALQGIPKVHLSPLGKSIYKLRKQKYDYGLCTHEALAHALGTIEGSEIKQKLLDYLEIMVDAHLKARTLS